MRKYIPNALSLSRVAMSLLILLAAANLNRTMFIVLANLVILAMITDFADGKLARRWDVCTDTGYVLDAMGDRAIHLSLTLVVLVRYDVSPIFVWLLIFRDIAIYAVRVLTPDWLARSREIQWISRFHATNLRIWLCSYFLKDGFRLFANRNPFDSWQYQTGQYILLIFTLLLSYWGLGKAFLWIWHTEPDPKPLMS